jgi:hypothetical protein
MRSDGDHDRHLESGAQHPRLVPVNTGRLFECRKSREDDNVKSFGMQPGASLDEAG